MDNFNRIEIYNKLNRIKPSKLNLKYPFNFWSPEKIKFTQKEIEIKFKNNPHKDKPKKKGGNVSKIIVF